jgi:type IV secretory pathway TrbL component
MEAVNSSFYFVTDKIAELQGFFIAQARNIAYVVLLISVCTAAVNYALTGTGLKENVIKIAKAVVFYSIVIFAYPGIVSWITTFTFQLARDSTYAPMAAALNNTSTAITEHAEEVRDLGTPGTYGDHAVTEYSNMFGRIINRRTFTAEGGNTIVYTTVAPAAALNAMMITVGECLHFAEKGSNEGMFGNMGKVITGIVCAFFILLVGIFAILEYLIAFIEFMFVSSVGIMLFPFSLWEGTKFIAEKYIGAMLGFFVKLLFCTICIFLLLYGYLTLSRQFSADSFRGSAEQITMIFFSCLLLLYVCKSAPALAQSLLTGTPSLNGAGAIGAVASAAGAVGLLAGGAKFIGGKAEKLGTGLGTGIMDVAGAITQGFGAGGAASDAAKDAGLGRAQQIAAGLGAFGKSMMSSAGESVMDKGAELTRSLMSGGRSGHHGAPGGENKHLSASQMYLKANEDGTRRSLGQVFQDKYQAGAKPFTPVPMATPFTPGETPPPPKPEKTPNAT